MSELPKEVAEWAGEMERELSRERFLEICRLVAERAPQKEKSFEKPPQPPTGLFVFA